MSPSTCNLIKDFIKSNIDASHRDSRTITYMVEVKHNIDKHSYQEALNGLLNLFIRQSDITAISGLDDLTKILNSTHHVRLDTGELTIRELLEEQRDD